VLIHRFLARALFTTTASAGFIAACQTLPPSEPVTAAGNAGTGQAGTTAAGSGGSAGSGGDSGGAGGSAGSGAGKGGSGGSGGSSGGNAGSNSGGGGAGGASGGAGGTGGDAGASDGGTGDGGADPGFFGDSRCTPDLLLCEDFEAASLDTTRWQIQSSGANPVIDDTRAARGMRSVHFATDDNGLSLIHTTEPFPVANNRYYGRLFVWFDSMPTAPEWAHWTIAASETDADDTEIRVGGQYDNTINRFGVGTDHGPTGDWTNLDEDPGDPVPVRTWVCVEWLHDGAADVTDFWWDGVARPSLHTTATDHGGSSSAEYLMPDIDSMFVGWWLYQAGTVPDHFDVWIDEVAIDDERIGCVD